jgi:hypothetical protein
MAGCACKGNFAYFDASLLTVLCLVHALVAAHAKAKWRTAQLQCTPIYLVHLLQKCLM